MVSLQKGLVGHWTMDTDDTSGGVLYDKSAYDNHGTLQNSPSTGQTGIVGEAYGFDGSSNYIQTPLTGDSIKNPYSISAWFNVNSINGSEMIVGNYDGSNGFLARLEGNDMFDLWHDTDSIEGGSVTLNKWTHVVYTYDGSNGAIYKNTSQVASGSLPDSTISNDLRIAETYDGRYLDGELDDVRIYDRVLTQDEILTLYNMRSQRQQNMATLINTTVNGKDVTLQNDSFGSWICVQNYEHYGGTNPNVSPGSTFPQLPDGDRLISDIENDGQNGELRHVDNISQYGNWEVDAVRLEAETQNHSRKINYYSKNQSVIDSIVNNSVNVGHSELKSSIEKYPDHTAFLPDDMGADNDNQTDARSDRIFGHGFPMYGNGSDGTRVHWAVAGFGNRWEVDDSPDTNFGETTIHRVWIRTGLF